VRKLPWKDLAPLQHAVHSAGGFLHLGDHVAGAGVDDDLGTESGGQRELGVVDIDGDHAQAHRPRVLHGDVAQTADAVDRHPLAGPGVGHLEVLVGGDAGAQDGSYFQWVDVVRDSWGVGGVDQHVGAEAAVDAVAAVLLPLAQRLPAGAAVFAPAARRPQPGVADLVADLEVVHPVTECDDGAVALVAGDERGLRLHRPVAVRRVQVGVADAGGLQFYQSLTVAGVGGSRSEISSGAPNSVTTAARMVSVVVSSVVVESRVCVMASFHS
jgi:hypothetical protein